MKFSYADLISGDNLYVPGIGHIRQPKLSDLKPSSVGIQKYHKYLQTFAWEKEDIIEIIRTALHKQIKAFDKANALNEFDLLFLIIPELRLMAEESLSFFISEHIEWDNEVNAVIVKDNCTNIIGYITRENFGELREAILQVNYIDVGKNAKPIWYDSKKTEDAWNRVQNYLKEESKKDTEDKKMELGNLISKLCIVSPSYNLINVYQLTIFQFYDQIFQCGYMRAVDLQSDIFSIYGGKDFKIDGWMQPLKNT